MDGAVLIIGSNPHAMLEGDPVTGMGEPKAQAASRRDADLEARGIAVLEAGHGGGAPGERPR